MGFVKKEGVREASFSVQKMADVWGLAETRGQEGQNSQSNMKMKPRDLTPEQDSDPTPENFPHSQGSQGTSQKPGLGWDKVGQRNSLC